MDDADWAARRALAPADSKAATFGYSSTPGQQSISQDAMARDATLRRRRRGIDVDDVLPLLIPALALLTTTTRRRDPIITGDAYHTCVLEGCANLIQPNEAHSFPYLATLVSVLFLGGIMLAWQAIAQEGQSTLMGIRVKPGPGGGG